MGGACFSLPPKNRRPYAAPSPTRSRSTAAARRPIASLQLRRQAQCLFPIAATLRFPNASFDLVAEAALLAAPNAFHRRRHRAWRNFRLALKHRFGEQILVGFLQTGVQILETQPPARGHQRQRRLKYTAGREAGDRIRLL